MKMMALSLCPSDKSQRTTFPKRFRRRWAECDLIRKTCFVAIDASHKAELGKYVEVV